MANEMNYKINIDAEIGNLQKNLNTLRAELDKTFDSKTKTQLESKINEVNDLMDTLRKKAAEPINSKGALDSLQKGVNKAGTAYKNLIDDVKQLQKVSKEKKISLIPESSQKTVNAMETALKNFSKAMEVSTKKSDEYVAAQREVNTINKNAQSVQSTIDKYQAYIKIQEEKLAATNKEDEAYNKIQKNINTYNATIDRETDKLKALQNQLTQAKASMEALAKSDASRTTKTQNAAFKELKQTLQDLGIETEDLRNVASKGNIEELGARVEVFKNQLIETSDQGMQRLVNEAEEGTKQIDTLSESVQTSTDAFVKQDEAINDTSAIVNRVKQFVGLTGIVRTMRKAVSNAVQTIKDLDAQMAEMAVVTNLDIGDYWNQLPEYTKRASELGVSIKSAYEAATLYYQQGLKTNEVIGVSNQTLKMARIAGLDAAEATDRMTAALRGFNMEVNETSAERVADVYSKLAAITASNVDEISTAMTKTASLAASAGMTFETTAAFLSQIIETTRESAETAGTALTEKFSA